MKPYAPIAIFTFKKLKPLQNTIKALQKNKLARESELYIFSDGPRSEGETVEVEEVRSYIKSISGFKKIEIFTQKKNKGLAKSVIEGVTHVLKDYGSIVVLEDDLLTSTNFLDFINQALKTYRTDEKVHSISGFTFPVRVPEDYGFDNYFTRRASSWGWATWKDRWEEVDWSVNDYERFSEDSAAKRKFNKMGSDMSGMLAKQMEGKISSWAIRWCYHQFKLDLYSVYPTVSKVSNIGFGENATHTKGGSERYATSLDVTGKSQFNFNTNPELNPCFIEQFVANFSIKTRIYYKIKDFLSF